MNTLEKNNRINKILAAAVTSAGMLLPATSQALSVPRGAAVDELAGNCNIGPFGQTAKAGPYNELCNVMEDPEKCLALIKQHFRFNGETVSVNQSFAPEKVEYCLSALEAVLVKQP